MERKHTPGPWRLDEAKNAHVLSHDYHSIGAGDGFHRDNSEGECGFGLAGYMSAADARLIAAAPDLLDALIDVLAGHNDPELFLPQVRRAIVKAGISLAPTRAANTEE